MVKYSIDAPTMTCWDIKCTSLCVCVFVRLENVAACQVGVTYLGAHLFKLCFSPQSVRCQGPSFWPLEKRPLGNIMSQHKMPSRELAITHMLVACSTKSATEQLNLKAIELRKKKRKSIANCSRSEIV